MPGFGRIVHVVNRTTDMLEVMDDGIPWPIRPGYKVVTNDDGDSVVVGAGPDGSVYMEPLPFFAAERAKRQNPIMGTENPYNIQDFQSLVAVPDWGDDYSHQEQSDAIERMDRSQLPDDVQNVKVVSGSGARRKVQKKVKGRIVEVVPDGRAIVMGEAQENIVGMKVND